MHLSSELDLASAYRRMGGAVTIALAAGVVLGYLRAAAWPVAAPFLILWIASPAIAVWISLSPFVAGRLAVTDTDARTLRLIARRTWRYFETFVTARDHMLPPDNFQEDPQPVLAHRTSPTNIGLYLLSVVSARDFGWLGTIDSVDRLEATLATLGRLQQYRGHFYNWYDTLDLHPLEPRYVSTVDSGNLAGHLITIGSSCRELMEKACVGPQLLSGMKDTGQLLREKLRKISDPARTQIVTRNKLINSVEAMMLSLDPLPFDSMHWATRFKELSAHAQTVADIAQALEQERGNSLESELRAWAETFKAGVESHCRDLKILNPWARLDSEVAIWLAKEFRDQSTEWSAIEGSLRS